MIEKKDIGMSEDFFIGMRNLYLKKKKQCLKAIFFIIVGKKGLQICRPLLLHCFCEKSRVLHFSYYFREYYSWIGSDVFGLIARIRVGFALD